MSVFKDREAVRAEMKLPATLNHSFVGAGDDFEARLEATILKHVDASRIRAREQRPSRNGRFIAYKYRVYYEAFEEVEAVYAAVSALEGIKFVI